MLELNQEQIQQVVGGAHANDGYTFSYIVNMSMLGAGIMLFPAMFLNLEHCGIKGFLGTVGFGAAAFGSYAIAMSTANIFDTLLFPSPSAGNKKPNERKVA